MNEEPGKQVVVLLRDLIFETKIKSTADTLGVPAAIVRTLPELVAMLDRGAIGLLIVDLNSAGPLAFDAIRLAKTHPGVRVLAFVSHVDADLAAQATQSGADVVLPRSRFSLQLPALLNSLLPQPDSGNGNEPI